MFDADNLNSTLIGLGVQERGTLFDQLDAAHKEPHRHYHTSDHISACLYAFDQVRELATRPTEIEIALWFHDSVYDTHRHDNEEKSSYWAWEYLLKAGVAEESVKRIVEMILIDSTSIKHQN